MTSLALILRQIPAVTAVQIQTTQCTFLREAQRGTIVSPEKKLPTYFVKQGSH